MALSFRRKIEVLLREKTLFEDRRLLDRVYAAETCSYYLNERQSGHAGDESDALRDKAQKLIDNIQHHNQQIVKRIVDQVEKRRLVGETLRAELSRFSGGRPADSSTSFAGLDGADWLVSEVFQLNGLPQNIDPYHPEMIQLEHTPVRALLHFAQSYPWCDGDVFVDIGCGPGIVTLLINLLTKIETVGVDIEPTYIHFASRNAERFNIRSVEFISGDARYVDLSKGTVFYLFTPFVGEIQKSMFCKIRTYAREHQISICTYGPITAIAEKESWLERGISFTPDPYTIAWYRSVV